MALFKLPGDYARPLIEKVRQGRAGLAGGMLKIQSRPGEGTRLFCVMPLDEHQGAVM